jgi:cytoskeletal protein CcmA (bactofilin family)
MEPDKNNPPSGENEPAKEEPQAPADALSRTPDDLETEKAEQAAANPTEKTDAEKTAEKKVSPIKKFLRKINLYFLIFMLLLVVAGVIAAVNYLNSQKAVTEPNIASQKLTQDALKQLANSDATVGSAAQTLTIQGNAIISGQTLMRGNLNVAGNFQTGGSIQGPSLTISGKSNLGETQINSLQVATNTAIQGSTTMRDLSVSGAATFSGAITASQITVSKLVLSGTGTLQLPNHLSFTGPSPSRSFIGSGILGSGGSVSISGSDTSGTINLNSGNSPNGSGCIVRINFQQAFPGQPHVLVSPVGSAAGGMEYYVERNNSGFSLCTNVAPTANKTFAFDYFVAG